MKVIFLDFDGVLNGYKDLMQHIHLDPVKAMRIRRLCKTTGAKVVFSTSWRILYNTEILKDMLMIVGGGYAGIDSTKQLPGDRGHEIKEWLERHPEVTHYVILDDDSDMLDEQLPYFVHTNGRIGITDEDVDKSIDILGKLPDVCPECSGYGHLEEDGEQHICCKCQGDGRLGQRKKTLKEVVEENV